MFYGTRHSLPFSSQPAIYPYPEADKFRLQHPILFKIHFNLILFSMPMSAIWFLPSSFPTKILYGFLLNPHVTWLFRAHNSAVIMTPVICLYLTVPVNTTSASKRKGKNPLEVYLKDED
jgi:hypothetical protein